MRKVLIFIICIILCIGLVGCGVNNSVASPLSAQKVAVDSATPLPTVLSDVEQFMKDYDIKLTAKDVQFDLVNNLDNKFVLQGYAELDNYYNYGFSSWEDEYFCIRVTSTDKDYSDQWYLYCSRNGLSDIYNKLKNEGKVNIIADCFIPKANYENNQGNLAVMIAVSY